MHGLKVYVLNFGSKNRSQRFALPEWGSLIVKEE